MTRKLLDSSCGFLAWWTQREIYYELWRTHWVDHEHYILARNVGMHSVIRLYEVDL